MTDRYEYHLETRAPNYPTERPYLLWRRGPSGWEYWSTVDWAWSGIDDRVRRAPHVAELTPVTAERADELTRDRSRWFRFWAVHSRPWPPQAETDPVTVVRRRAGGQSPRDESYHGRRGWITTSLLRQEEVGRSSDLPLLRPVDVAEAEAILRRRFGVTDATGR